MTTATGNTDSLTLVAIPEDAYSSYRYEAIFRAFKWDPQVEDRNTVSKHALVLRADAARGLESLVRELAAETVAMERALLDRRDLLRDLGIPKKLLGPLARMPAPDIRSHPRLMRFDFHPTANGWALSEVNSDVPGGFAEASILPALAARYFPGTAPGPNTARRLAESLSARMPKAGTAALIHATSYADDRQVMQCIAEALRDAGHEAVLAAPDHLRWRDRRANCIAEGSEGPIDGIVRFFPLEWMPQLPRSAPWQGYFDCDTPSCNHPIAMFTQTKRLPLVWDALGVDVPTWKRLLPETIEARGAIPTDPAWILKPALGRVGEAITIAGSMTDKELGRVHRAARRHPRDWVAQRLFRSRPLPSPDGGEYHVCVGAFAIDGEPAGFYGRMSPHPRIDARAEDVPILLETEG